MSLCRPCCEMFAFEVQGTRFAEVGGAHEPAMNASATNKISTIASAVYHMLNLPLAAYRRGSRERYTETVTNIVRNLKLPGLIAGAQYALKRRSTWAADHEIAHIVCTVIYALLSSRELYAYLARVSPFDREDGGRIRNMYAKYPPELNGWTLSAPLSSGCSEDNTVNAVNAIVGLLLEVWMLQRLLLECHGCHKKSQLAKEHSCTEKATMTKERCRARLEELVNHLEPHRLRGVSRDLLKARNLFQPEDDTLAWVTRTVLYTMMASFEVYKRASSLACKMNVDPDWLMSRYNAA